MKKLLRLDEFSKGGRQKEDIHDVLGLRAVVQPREDLPPDEVRGLPLILITGSETHFK